MRRASFLAAVAVPFFLVAISSTSVDAQCCQAQPVSQNACFQTVMVNQCCQPTVRTRRWRSSTTVAYRWRARSVSTCATPVQTIAMAPSPCASNVVVATPSCGCGNQVASFSPARMPVGGMNQRTDTVFQNCNALYNSCCQQHNCSTPQGQTFCENERRKCVCINQCNTIPDPAERLACQNACANIGMGGN